MNIAISSADAGIIILLLLNVFVTAANFSELRKIREVLSSNPR